MLRTFLTLAELISPFLAMLSMSSRLVEPLHLQAMIGERAGGGLKASRRNRLSINPFRAPLLRGHMSITHSQPQFALIRRPPRQSVNPPPWPLVSRPARDTSARSSLTRPTPRTVI